MCDCRYIYKIFDVAMEDLEEFATKVESTTLQNCSRFCRVQSFQA